ncbi:hypothetical protein LTR53_003128 [Teratosphaeriaceae sp. CCFEE 6253]|nr:hypothetical protein LTR53_003128 [Teratosphaeriaceae sp. CCFEE 6253]
MQTTRISTRLPQVCRVIKAAPTNTPTRTMSLLPRFVANELNSFAPMFRLMEDYASHVSDRDGPASFTNSSLARFQPKFDVKETKDTYELRGELPGIEQRDVDIEFADAQTLVIKGQTETVREEHPTEPAKLTEGGEEATKSHQATVEDESAAPHEAEPTVPAEPTTEVAQYWLREMSRGAFSRTFTFPARVDHDAVKASLKNGILNIVVPKAAAPQSRRIDIE